MGIEAATFIAQLLSTNPISADGKNTTDDHLRLIKAVLQASFPAVSNSLTATDVELSYVDGVTSGVQAQIDLTASVTGTSAFTLSGFSGTVSGSYIYAKSANIVAVYQPQANGTSNASSMSCTSTPLPEAIRPARTQRIPRVVMRNNGSIFSTGGALILSTGVISYLRSNLDGGANTFNPSGTKGIEACVFSYALN